MMSNKQMVYGNLALSPKYEAAEPRFTVVEGYGSEETVSVPHADTSHAARVRFVVAGAVIIVSIVCVLAGIVLRDQTRASLMSNATFSQITVEAGDTLWSIAEDHEISGLSTRDNVALIQQKNGLDSATLMPGQKLLVARPTQ